MERRNLLDGETSPYLRQHKDNPVAWRPWGAAAFAEARELGRPVFLSIGYAACHWCHVMARESFEDGDVAALLDAGFVAVKVDREERPDVDAIYMDAVQALGRPGGWPLSVFLDPEGRPFFGGTYYPREAFLELLRQIDEAWRDGRARVGAAAADLAAFLAAEDRRAAGPLSPAVLADFAAAWLARRDPLFGGRRGAPKFPPAHDARLLLRIWRRTGDVEALETAKGALDGMLRGGVHDQLGGGFHRYSVDERWLVPHFEKMLYDQANLAEAYLDAHLATGDPLYARVARSTLDYVLSDLAAPEGGFACAEDADSPGGEGAFYVFAADELRAALAPDEYEAFAAAYDVTDEGNMDGANVLALRPGAPFAEQRGPLGAARRKALALRARRERPARDDKVLADWNGLAVAALARAGRALDEPRYAAAAARAATHLLERLAAPGGGLLHVRRGAGEGVRGALADYAFVVRGLLQLYQSDFDPRWLEEAARLAAKQDELFWSEERGDYFSTDGTDATLIVRRVEPFDGAVPAGRSIAALNLLDLATLLAEPRLRARAERLFASTPADAARAPLAFAALLAAWDEYLHGGISAVVVGDRRDPAALGAARRLAAAGAVVALGAGEDAARVPALARREAGGRAPSIHVCRDGVCLPPTTNVAAALRAVAGR